MADRLDPVSVAALALLQELVNQMPPREQRLEGTHLWSAEGIEVQSRRDLEKGRFDLLVDGVSVVSVDVWPLLDRAGDE